MVSKDKFRLDNLKLIKKIKALKKWKYNLGFKLVNWLKKEKYLKNKMFIK